jgi:hypothetical protein
VGFVFGDEVACGGHLVMGSFSMMS